MLTAEDLSTEDYRAGLRSWLIERQSALAPYRSTHAATHAELVTLGRQLARELWDADWKRWGWPRDAGGLGGGPLHRAVLYDELGGQGLLLPETDYVAEVLGDATIRFAPEIARKLLADFVSGREIWAQGFSEPEAGSDLASLRTRAVRDGDDYVVSGQKIWTSNGYLADRLFTLVRTGTPDSRHRGISALLIDTDIPGVTIRPLTYASGLDEMAECFFDDVRVPADRLIGAENAGWGVAMFLLQFERGMYAWMRHVWLRGRIRELAAQVKATDTASAEALGRAYQTVCALRARSAATVRRLAAGEMVGPEASADKVLLATAEQTTLDTARQLLFPAFETDPAAEGWRSDWWYTRAASVYGGSGEVQRTILADRVLHLPAEDGRERKG